MRTTVRTILAFAALAAAASAYATPIAYEGGNLEWGFSDTWTGTGGSSSTTGGLSAVGVKTSTGYISASNTTGAGYARTLSTAAIQNALGTTTIGVGDQTVWLSFIGYRTTTGTVTNLTPYAYHVDLSSSGSIDRIGIGGYRGNNNAYINQVLTGAQNNTNYWGITATDGTTQEGVRVNNTVGTTSGASDFILVKLDFNQVAQDQLSLWIDPNLSGGESGLGTALTTMSGNYATDISRIRIFAGANTTFYVDELRLATTFEGAIPEPSTYALLFGAATLGFVGYRRFRKRAV